MAFHRVAVNIDGDRACANRVAFAAGIAGRFGGELVLGGATRDILDQMPVPVLMSH